MNTANLLAASTQMQVQHQQRSPLDRQSDRVEGEVRGALAVGGERAFFRPGGTPPPGPARLGRDRREVGADIGL